MRRFLANRQTVNKVTSNTKAGNEGEENASSKTATCDLQAGHGSHFAGVHYARDSLDVFRDMSWHMREKFKYVSEEWHLLLGFQPVGTNSFVPPRTTFAEREGEAAANDRRMRVEQTCLDKALTQVLSSADAVFRGLQRLVLQDVV